MLLHSSGSVHPSTRAAAGASLGPLLSQATPKTPNSFFGGAVGAGSPGFGAGGAGFGFGGGVGFGGGGHATSSPLGYPTPSSAIGSGRDSGDGAGEQVLDQATLMRLTRERDRVHGLGAAAPLMDMEELTAVMHQV